MILTMDLLFINVVWIFVFFFNDTATTEIYTLSHTTLFRSPGPTSLPVAPVRRQRPDLRWHGARRPCHAGSRRGHGGRSRSEEHTSELQSPCNLVCRLLLEKIKALYIHAVCARTMLLLQMLQ